MLWVLTNIKKVAEFREEFYKSHDGLNIIDLSKIPLKNLADECDSIVNHHKSCAIFVGYLEAGWMLELCDQTRIRKLFRKFPVAVISFFPESLPYSWKTDIEILYTEGLTQNGESDTFNDGCVVQHKPKDGHNKVARKSSAK